MQGSTVTRYPPADSTEGLALQDPVLHHLVNSISIRLIVNILPHPRWIREYNLPRPALAYPVHQTEPVSIQPVLRGNTGKRTI